jgi:hypothetical protein
MTECLACNNTGFMGSESNPGRSYCPVCPAGKDRRSEDRDAKREATRAHYEAKAKEAHDTHVFIVLDALVVADQKAWADTQLDLSLRETAEIAVTALEDDGITFARTTEETP